MRPKEPVKRKKKKRKLETSRPNNLMSKMKTKQKKLKKIQCRRRKPESAWVT